MNVVERGACLRVCVSVITKMSKRTSTERVARSYWDWLPPELQQWILRLVRLDAANLLRELVATPSDLRRLRQRFCLPRTRFPPSWNDVMHMQLIFARGPLLECFRPHRQRRHYDDDRRVVNHFFTIDGYESISGHWFKNIEYIHEGYRNVDALVCYTVARMYCAYKAWDGVNDEIEEERLQAGDDTYCCDTFPQLRFLVKTAFQRPPQNRWRLRQVERNFLRLP